MSSFRSDSKIAELDKIIQDPLHASAFQVHLEDVLRGKSLFGSPRSQQFLRHIIEKALAGDFESLKERVIAIELFNRSPSYDKSEDAIVRVVASDVRKRLAQHYKLNSGKSDFQIDLPPGSYIPEITYFGVAASQSLAPPATAPPPAAPQIEHPLELEVVHEVFSSPQPTAPVVSELPPVRARLPRRALPWAIASAMILAFVMGYFCRDIARIRDGQQNQFYPWSLMSVPGRSLQIVTSDPDFASIQDITGRSLSLSDYANGRYFPLQGSTPFNAWNLLLTHFQGSRAANADIPIAVDAAKLARSKGEMAVIHPSRSLHLSDFHTDDDFLLMGGPLANPWLEMFRDRLDFRFVFLGPSSNASIENVHPLAKELPVYSQLKSGFELSPPTDSEYGIIALVQNPPQAGHVLIVAGTGAESTAAAGALVMNRVRMDGALNQCTNPNAPFSEFEILLRVDVMAGSSTRTAVLACHRLGNQ